MQAKQGACDSHGFDVLVRAQANKVMGLYLNNAFGYLGNKVYFGMKKIQSSPTSIHPRREA
jgi:hypothetical protein